MMDEHNKNFLKNMAPLLIVGVIMFIMLIAMEG